MLGKTPIMWLDVGCYVIILVTKRSQAESEKLISIVGVEPDLGVFLDAEPIHRGRGRAAL